MTDITKPGTTILIATDQGPKGPCGQSMNTTCSHCAIHVFEDECTMRQFIEDNLNWCRNGKNPQLFYLTVGEGQSLGTSLTIHKSTHGPPTVPPAQRTTAK